MNSLFLAISSVCCLVLGYSVYGRYIDKYIVLPDNKLTTPAHTGNDSGDFYPANKFLLFGHHFSSIAGAGPIVGPIIGVFYFGWAPVVLWILVGGIFIGAVHDYLSLMLSVRHGGESIGALSGRIISQKARIIFSSFLWFALIIIMVVFAIFGAGTLVKEPAVVLPALLLIPIAMIVGLLVYRIKWPVAVSTIAGLLMLGGAIVLGVRYPVEITFMNAQQFWFFILLGYSAIASLLPVWLLLQPRDYLSSFILYTGMGCGFVGLFLTRPVIHAPAFLSLTSSIGPLWPMMFVVVACGAISGFHSLVSSGTSSKQLNKERDGRFIGMGAMLTESALAVFAVCCVVAGLQWDVFRDLFQSSSGGNLIAFAEGFGSLTAKVGLPKPVLVSFALLMVNAFILTTLDTTARLGRFVFVETMPKKAHFLKHKSTATIIMCVCVFYLGYSGQWKAIWPLFGTANQLIASLTLLVITAYLLSCKKPALLTLVPAIIMIATTITALSYGCYNYLIVQESRNLMLGIFSVLLLLLSIIMCIETIDKLKKRGCNG